MNLQHRAGCLWDRAVQQPYHFKPGFQTMKEALAICTQGPEWAIHTYGDSWETVEYCPGCGISTSARPLGEIRRVEAVAGGHEMTERIPRERDPARIAHMMDTSACRLDSLDDVWHCMASALGVPTYWRGVPVWKNQFDMRRYFDLITRERFGAVIETGCQGGGSSLFFMDVLKQIDGLTQEVRTWDKALKVDSVYIGIDIEGGWCDAAKQYEYPHVFIRGDCLSEEVHHAAAEAMLCGRSEADGRRKVLVVLDSVHTEEHVTEELRIYSPLADYLVVEDSDHGGRPVLDNYGPCAFEAVEKFLATGAPFVRDAEIESRYGAFTNSPGGWLRRR